MGKSIIRILGSMIASYLGIALTLGVAAAFGLVAAIQKDYAVQMCANVVLTMVVICMILLYSKKLGGIPVRMYSFAWSSRDAAFASTILVLTFGITWLAMSVLVETRSHAISSITPQWGVILVGLIGECGALHEEVLSRGYILTHLQKRVGMGWAIFLSAICFALVHVPMKGFSFMIVSWFLGGLVYSYLYIKSGSLWVSLSAHASHNFATNLLMTPENHIISHLTTSLNAVEKIAFEIILSAIVFLVTYLFYGKGTRFLELSPRLVKRWAKYANPSDKTIDTTNKILKEGVQCLKR